MGARRWARWLLATATCALLVAPAAAQNNAAFDRGYREGIQRGADDARRGRQFEIDRNDIYRDGDRGYNAGYGNRDSYRNDFRRGYTSGYRTGYNNVRGDAGYQRGNATVTMAATIADRDGCAVIRSPRSRAATATGGSKGLDDGRDRDRYDPTRHGDYRSADQRLLAVVRIEGRLQEQLPVWLPSGLRETATATRRGARIGDKSQRSGPRPNDAETPNFQRESGSWASVFERGWEFGSWRLGIDRVK